MKKVTADEMRWQVSQLKKDKLVYAVESAAVSLVVMVLIFGLGIALPIVGLYAQTVMRLLLIIAVGYFLYMAAGNTKRCLKIRKLERMLDDQG
ncbi:MAG: hypothetical protein UX85_C0001G0278 [Candidatus Beckwithbacteria bacterium GW2011_GWB1_47_15]|uniref:Uncharacterized protein n=1 Tax=Candidatus Beckwithbacteria bacterium GW2011_GWB1_47_15 TaxID=1618371 RepID=A0A0G1RXJ6_9BACT|nr:MAG: hypothetical protein UY43_C0001G0847 [Candidatus Beckwithbacteria bacterium GW2011_GWC1_49_16]AQS30916.1 hypothetical protein [uncultured bacterium]KKU36100.1 MAG: hypothetical protein UX50_C0001G0277 [Candidatus Beckwithbacteria bacterium GW2011_GWA1_46_30]KKU62064.1 MAG: hypothetical protein UX85_C0001G0278 [Candidatus Beckwithbacteria bacterium GW2011_GWB1_47_15]KKU72383.1 MAG: hypothetical protein UX97_C0001G0253 [Candidatus Beckwithbacteria bacterium GW2011_GWA2_47_25]OGD49290.1 M